MTASKNSKFPFVTVSFANIFNVNNNHMGDLQGMPAILENTNVNITLKNCKNLVYHDSAIAAKEYQKSLSF